MLRKFVAIGLFVTLLTGCGEKKQDDVVEVDKYMEQIEQLQIELDNEKKENNIIQIKSDGKVEALQETIEIQKQIIDEQEDLIDYLQEIVKDISGIEDNVKILFEGIGIGSSDTEVEEAFGNDYTTESTYDERFDMPLTIWTYPNAEVIFTDNKVIEVMLYNDYYDTNFGVNVGDFAHQAINICDDFLLEYVSAHAVDGIPNLGWYNDNDGGTVIMYFNDKEDKLNSDINIETARINKIDLKSSWMFD
ncbi:MAG: hypothetical protein K0R15_1045 [Clostridiales bacterium]|jgi:hypothetical protein|nr:hypothetical protein [Clostridiales bacterium]